MLYKCLQNLILHNIGATLPVTAQRSILKSKMSKKISLRAINFFNDEHFDPNSDEHKTSKNKVETSSDDINRYLTDQYKIKGKASRVEMSPVVSKRIKKKNLTTLTSPRHPEPLPIMGVSLI